MPVLRVNKGALKEIVGKAIDTKLTALKEQRTAGGAPGDAVLGIHNAMPDGGGSLPQATANKSKERKGLSLARWIQCSGASQLLAKEKSIHRSPQEIAKELYPLDDMLNKAYAVYGNKALSISDFTSGGAFGMQEMAQEVIEFLRPATSVRRSPVEVMQMRTGSLRISKVTNGSQASYVGENQVGGITQPSTGDVELSRKKLKAEIPMSMDLFRFAVVNADAVIRNDLVRALAQREDSAFIRDDGTQFTPRGLRFIVPATNVIAAGANDLTGIEATLGNMELVIRQNDVPMAGLWWLLSPRTERRLKTVRTGPLQDYAYREEMNGGNLNGFPFAVTTLIPENLGGGADTELYLYAAPMFIIGEAMDLEIMTSLEAAYNDNGTLRSPFSRDQMVTRAIAQHDFAARHDFAVAVSPDVDWVVV